MGFPPENFFKKVPPSPLKGKHFNCLSIIWPGLVISLPAWNWIERNFSCLFDYFEMSIQCGQRDTGLCSSGGNETVGKTDSLPFAAEIEGESPGCSP